MKIKNLIFNIVISILSVILVITTASVAYSFWDYSRVYVYDEERFWNCIQSESYDYIVSCMYENEINGVKTTKDLEECYAVARYFEAASFYKAYEQNGKTDKAKEKQKIMEEQKEKMGELSFAAGDIDAFLEGIVKK